MKDPMTEKPRSFKNVLLFTTLVILAAVSYMFARQVTPHPDHEPIANVQAVNMAK